MSRTSLSGVGAHLIGVVTASPYDSALPRARLPVTLALSICPLNPSIPNPFLPCSQGSDGLFAYWSPSLEGLGLIRESQRLGKHTAAEQRLQVMETGLRRADSY